jgi:DNA ligase-1
MKPMLASPVKDFAKIEYPVLASPKLDGIRCIIFGGVALSRSLEPIPNKYVQRVLGDVPEFEGLDGELIVGPPTAKNVFQVTESAVMTVDGEPDFQFYVFDHNHMSAKPGERGSGFRDRLKRAVGLCRGHKYLSPVPHTMLMNENALLKYEAEQLAKGYEGVMLRAPDGPYKHGRSTFNEGWLLKLKRFEDSEAEIVGFEPLMHNANEAKRNKLGQLERSSHKSGKVAMNMLGSLAVKDVNTGVLFGIGSGFTAGQRTELWVKRKTLKGRIVKYKYQPTGVKEKPRFPVFIGFRDRLDL